MSKDYHKMYEERLANMKKKVMGSKIADILELKDIGNKKLDEIRSKMSVIVPGKNQVWDDFNFRTGKIFGILRFIGQNPQYRQQLLEVTGLNQNHVDIYFNVCGNLPYLNRTDNSINEGRPMDVEATKEFITVVAAEFGVVVEDSDLVDITQERWDRLYMSALEKIQETAKHNAEYGESVPEQFDE